MREQTTLKFSLDIFGFIALILTFISILFSFNLSTSEIMIAIGSFLIIVATYIYISFRGIINNQAREIIKLNEKVNIHKDISDLKAKVDLLMDYFKMKKRGQGDLVEVLIRIIQVAAILIAGYIILKALGIIA